MLLSRLRVGNQRFKTGAFARRHFKAYVRSHAKRIARVEPMGNLLLATIH
jgi:hypothetical protein